MERGKINILIVGGYPPPYGGITTHVKRLHEYLLNNGTNCYVLIGILKKPSHPPNSYRIYLLSKIFFKIFFHINIIHIHVSAFGNVLKILSILVFFIRKKIIVTIHSGSFTNRFNRLSKIKKRLIGFTLYKSDKIITVNKEQKNFIIKNFPSLKTNVNVIPAFIFPNACDLFYKGDIRRLFLKWNLILLTSGYLLDHYGYEMVLEYLENHQNSFGVFVFYGTCNPKYRKRIMDRIKILNNLIYFENLVTEEFNFLLKNVDIYVRNTNRDGDCVAIHEAAYWGIKVVASDSVPRPEGAKLFKFNDIKSFEKSINSVMSEKECGIINENSDNAEKIFKLYYEVLNGQ